MNRRQNDIIGAVAGYCLIACIVVTIVGGLAIVQTQDASDQAVAAQQELACFQHARMCVAVNEAEKK